MHGYGGYHHPRFWTDTVALMREHYGLADDASILDVGCAGLHAARLPVVLGALQGLDVSDYAISNAHPPSGPAARGDAAACCLPTGLSPGDQHQCGA
jgi:predicted TPR repeat methyltransferase